MNPGEFSCADLVAAQIKAEAMWKDAAFMKHNKVQSISAQAILAEQTAEIATQVEDSQKDNVVRVYWSEDCSDDVQDCSDECTINGQEAQSGCQDYEIGLCRDYEITVSEKRFRTSNLGRDEVLATQWSKALQKLDEDVAKTVVSKIDSFAGVNQYTGGIGTVSGTETYIDPANMNAELVSYLTQVAVLNRSTNPYILDGDLTFQQHVLAGFKQSDPSHSADLPMLESFRKYFDLFNMNAVLAPERKMFLIDPGAVAIASKNYYGETPVTISNGANITRFSVESPSLRRKDGRALRYDVIYKTRCVGSDIFHDYKFIARFDVFLNPASACDPTNTGVLSFVCGVAP